MQKILIIMYLYYLSTESGNIFRVKLKNYDNRTIYFINSFDFYSTSLTLPSSNIGLSFLIKHPDKKITLRLKKTTQSPSGYFLVDFDRYSKFRNTKLKVKKAMSGINKLKKVNRNVLEHSKIDSILPNDSVYIDLKLDKYMFYRENYYNVDTDSIVDVDSLMCTAFIRLFYSFQKNNREKYIDSYLDPKFYKGFNRTEIKSEPIKFPIYD